MEKGQCGCAFRTLQFLIWILQNLPARAHLPGQISKDIFRFQINPNVGSVTPRFEYQLGTKRVHEDVDEHNDKRVRIS